tara:strand:+ start:716 stop:1858 length:1143 start_codon:yes stop_codon:yes gene_type:complete
MNLVSENYITNYNKKYKTIEQIKYKIEPYLKNVINNVKYELLDSYKVDKININFNYDNISLENYYSIAHEYNKNIDYLRQNILSYFIPSNITKNILSKFTYYKRYKFTYKNRLINLHLFNDKSMFDYRLLTTIISKGFAFLEYSNSKRRDIEFYYIPTNFKKQFPEKEIIGPNNVNSAFTSFNRDGSGNRIVIFRKEEAAKVFIHELVHFINMDFSFKNQSQVNKLIVENFDIDKKDKFINLFEAYTDSIAIIYNTIFNSILLDKSASNLIRDEINYQYKVLCKILKFSNMNHILKNKNKSKNILKQNSNVLSYYFIKYGLLKNPQIFLNKFDINANWNENKILEIYNVSKNILDKTKFKIDSINPNNSLRMTYNNINVI